MCLANVGQSSLSASVPCQSSLSASVFLVAFCHRDAEARKGSAESTRNDEAGAEAIREEREAKSGWLLFRLGGDTKAMFSDGLLLLRSCPDLFFVACFLFNGARVLIHRLSYADKPGIA